MENGKIRKTFVIDTSVLLYDKTSVHSFPGNDLVIPLVVLDELDRFKDKRGIVGENARYVNRFLDDLRQQGSLHEGVELKGSNQTIRVAVGDPVEIPFGLDTKSGDNKIIALAHKMIKSKVKGASPVVVVTKDINFRVKCDTLGISAEDFYKDNVPQEANLYSGSREILIPSDQIDELYKRGYIRNEVSENLPAYPNELLVMNSSTRENHTSLGIYRDKKITLIPKNLKVSSGSGVKVNPRNKEQKFALALLEDPNIPLITLTGIAGSGKTFLTLMSGLSGIWQGDYSRIVITRPIIPVGRDLGYLPGDIDEKMAPWLTPIEDNFRDGVKDNGTTYFEMMKEKGEIEVAPLSFIRGRTFNNVFMIVDEAQNATIHELKTVITRMGENSKLVLLGDTDQVDTPYIDSCSNGLTIVIEKFKDSQLSGHIRLPKGERSELATAGSRIL